MSTNFDDLLRAIDSRLAPTPADKRRELSRALMGAGAALLQAGAPRRGPRQGTLGGLGYGLLGFQQGLDASRNDALNQRIKKLQLGAMLGNTAAALAKANEVQQPKDEIVRLQERLKEPLLPAERAQIEARIAKLNYQRPATSVNQAVGMGPRFGEKQDEEARAKVLNAGDNAAVQLSGIRRMGDLIAQAKTQTGSLQPLVTGLQGIAADAGIDVEGVGKKLGINVGNLTNKEDFRRLSNGVTLGLISNLKGSLQVKELEFLKESTAGLGLNEETNIRALSAMQAAQELAQKRSDELQMEEAKTPNNLRGAFMRYRRNRKPDLKFLRDRTAEIQKDLLARRNANVGSGAMDTLEERLRNAKTQDEINSVLEEIKRLQGALNGR